MSVLGFDTSNYTTSAAVYDGAQGHFASRLLDVKPGQLGLRQSDALFAHVQRLPEITAQLFDNLARDSITAVGASTRPRAVEGSYMPCFLAGASQARTLAKILNVPFYAFSHQQGHIAAALWSAGRMDLLQSPHLAWHLSGGTTELLFVQPEGKTVRAEKIGGTSDISAGQIVDRTGKLLGLPFPSGKALDALASAQTGGEFFKVKTEKLTFSLSGLENKIQAFRAGGADDAQTAHYAMRSLCNVLYRITEQALLQYPGFSVVFSGGVSSNAMLRQTMAPLQGVFAAPQLSADNAMGIAILTYLQEN